jgi:hypothetical protein
LVQQAEVRAAEDRHDLARPAAVIALIVAAALALGGHWLVELAVAAAGAFAFLNTALELRSLGDPHATEAFYRLADPRQPLELPGDAAPSVAEDVPDRTG